MELENEACDVVFIQGLCLPAKIGVLAWEQQIVQKLYVDLEMSTSIQAAAASDDIAQALNYAEVAQSLQGLVSEGAYQLIETVAEQMAQHLLSHFPIKKVKLSLNKKGALPNSSGVGVIIERSKGLADG